MAKAVKTAPTRREQKALATRRRVLDAAEALFVRNGYAFTTIASIADEADVAVQTVYAVFDNKRTILRELLDIRVIGEDDGAPLAAREDWQTMENEPDPRRQLTQMATIATSIGSRLAGLYGVLAEAAGADREISELYRRQQRSRYRDQQRVARALARRGALKPGLSEARATDIMWAIANPNMYRSLVGERRWKADEYERWLAETLTAALLR
jgi:TetR/AcrR family transcriptional regulator, regulator of autoinduction and epiphytic fitness